MSANNYSWILAFGIAGITIPIGIFLSMFLLNKILKLIGFDKKGLNKK